MQRLLQADVGAGKTAVAVYALLASVANKHQAALMAPTEVLAQQHWQTLDRYLEQSRVRRKLVTSALTPSERRSFLQDLRQGKIDLVVGTQALVQEDVEFSRLGLIVIDEQHRFGVGQRARLRRGGIDPHYLVMTATPIPRTIALTVFGDLDVTIIRQMPPGRQPVVTHCCPLSERSSVYAKVRQAFCQGRQAFIVCPQVDESERAAGNSAVQTYADLQAGPLAGCRLELLHGGMPNHVKDDIMQRFRQKEFVALVTTTLIEVGIDIPQASVMVIEHAQRFGLSQLHQLRGRIGRGSVAGECFAIVDPKSDDARQRLRLFARITDGFALAEHDMRLRGMGQFFGMRQHGLGELHVADLAADKDILHLARKDAFALIARDPVLAEKEHVLLRRAVLERYGSALDLSTIG
jgi:ATP-dependent DNA helicase RecG